jgi:tripartite-type tricarboxylate transporter receptor subunit TctC
MVEAGVVGFDAQAWFGLFAPAGTPAPIVSRLEAETIKALRDPKVQEAFRTNGAEPMGTTAAQFGRFFLNEIDKWAKVVTSAQVKPE